MEYFRINYNKLKNLKQLNYFLFIMFVVSIFIILIIISCFINIYKRETLYGIYKDNILHLKINVTLSDDLKNNKYIIFNNEEITYKILEYGEYEIVNNEIYQLVDLTIEGNFMDNEVGVVKLFNNQKLITYIFDLFK